jgi:hypothetical protein
LDQECLHTFGQHDEALHRCKTLTEKAENFVHEHGGAAYRRQQRRAEAAERAAERNRRAEEREARAEERRKRRAQERLRGGS